MLSDAKIRVRSGMYSKPVWFDFMVHHAPMKPVLPSKGFIKPGKLEYPEDKLRKIYLERNPAATLYPLRFLPFENTAKYAITSPADVFASKQIQIMQQKGMTEDEAYYETEKWMKERVYASELEIELLEAQIGAEDAPIEGVNVGVNTPADKIMEVINPDFEIESADDDGRQGELEQMETSDQDTAPKEIDAITASRDRIQEFRSVFRGREIREITEKVSEEQTEETFAQLRKRHGSNKRTVSEEEILNLIKYKLFPRERDPEYLAEGELRVKPGQKSKRDEFSDYMMEGQ